MVSGTRAGTGLRVRDGAAGLELGRLLLCVHVLAECELSLPAGEAPPRDGCSDVHVLVGSGTTGEEVGVGETGEFGAGDVGDALELREEARLGEGREGGRSAAARVGEVADEQGGVVLGSDATFAIIEDVAMAISLRQSLVHPVQHTATRCIVRADVDGRGGVVEPDEDCVARVLEKLTVGFGEGGGIGKSRRDGRVS